MRGVVLADDRRGAHDLGRAAFVDRRDAQRRLESAGPVHGDAIEPDEMRRADQHDHVKGPAGQQTVGVGGDRAGVDQAGMGRDQGGQRIELNADVCARERQVAVDGPGQRLCRTGIPGSGHCGRSDVLHRATITAYRNCLRT